MAQVQPAASAALCVTDAWQALIAVVLGEEPRAALGELPGSKHGDERLVSGT
jgi:hypothetical protein